MSEEIKPEETKPEEKPQESQKTPEELVAELTAERDKWKSLSRQNEKKWEDASGELSKLKEAQMSDAEKALEAARTEGRTSALSEISKDLITAELRIQATTAGATLPDLKFLNLDQLKGEDGRPNPDAVRAFVESLPKAGTEFPNLQGAGKQSGGAPEITTMDPNELADLITGGSIF